MNTRRAPSLTRKAIAALSVARVVPHRPATLGPAALLATARKPKRRDDEHAHQSEYIAWCRSEGAAIYPELAFIYAVPNGARTGMRTAVKMKREGLLSGVFDCALDVARGGWFGFKAEWKTQTGTTSPAQREYMIRTTEAGYFCVVFRDQEQAREITLNYLAKEPTQVVR